MKWKAEDMEKLLGMEEYVDTLVYPVSVSPMEWDMSWIADQFWLDKVCNQVEQNLTGRVFLFQPLCVAREGDFLETTLPFIRSTIHAMAKRFPYKVIVTNSQELAEACREEGIYCIELSPVPEEGVSSKRFLEKTLIEANRVGQKLIDSWHS